MIHSSINVFSFGNFWFSDLMIPQKIHLWTFYFIELTLFNFKEVEESRFHWVVNDNCFRNYDGGCVKYTGDKCECYEDLYLMNK